MLSETYHGHLSQNILKITILIAMHLNEKTIPGVYIHENYSEVILITYLYIY